MSKENRKIDFLIGMVCDLHDNIEFKRDNKELIVWNTFAHIKDNFEIPVLYCNNLNDTAVVNTLRKSKPDIVVFTGGGLIRNEVLEHSGAGILNCHMGILPQYRGMDVVEWPILENNFGQVGVTIHFMDKGIDTGDILQIKKIKVEQNKNIKQLRDRFEPIMCRQMVKTCLDYLDGRLERITQQQEDGKQYFIMHPFLIKLAESKMKQRISTQNEQKG